MVFALDFFLFGINSPPNTRWPLTPLFPAGWSITWSTFDLGRFFWASQTSNRWSNARFGPSLGSRASARYGACLTCLKLVRKPLLLSPGKQYLHSIVPSLPSMQVHHRIWSLQFLTALGKLGHLLQVPGRSWHVSVFQFLRCNGKNVNVYQPTNLWCHKLN